MDRTRNLGAMLVLWACALGAPLHACAESKVGKASVLTTAPQKVNGSGVSVQYRVDPQPQVGRTTSILLSFGGISDPAGAQVQLGLGGGLSLATTVASRTLPAGQVSTWTVDVVPSGQGIGYLHVFTTQNGTTSSTSIPVQVGKAPASMPSIGELKSESGKDRILSMPVK